MFPLGPPTSKHQKVFPLHDLQIELDSLRNSRGDIEFCHNCPEPRNRPWHLQADKLEPSVVSNQYQASACISRGPYASAFQNSKCTQISRFHTGLWNKHL